MTNNFKQYRNKESGETVEARFCYDIKGEPFLMDKKCSICTYTTPIAKQIKEFLEQYEPIENDNDK